MRNVRREVVIWINLVTIVVTWVILIFLSTGGLKITWEAAKPLPEVVTIYTVLYLVFITWVWRLPFLQGWLVTFPDLQGTWQGTVQTTWRADTDKKEAPIPVILVIKHSFNFISCVMFSQESISYSNAALLSEEEESGLKKLSYVFTNTPILDARGRSPIHDGAAILRIITTPERSLEGEYWTNRKTTGTISLKFRSRKCLEKFPDDLIPQSK
jgi:SMODS-associating 2TM, beta-strand rich effector domain